MVYPKMAISEIKSMRDQVDNKVYEYIVVAGDSLTKIAIQKNTTVDELKAMNPGAALIIKPGQKLRYHKTEMKQAIVNLHPHTSVNIALRHSRRSGLRRI